MDDVVVMEQRVSKTNDCKQDAFEVVNESLDIAVTLLERFGSSVSAKGYNQQLLPLLLPLLSDHRMALRKRTIACLGASSLLHPVSRHATWGKTPPAWRAHSIKLACSDVAITCDISASRAFNVQDLNRSCRHV